MREFVISAADHGRRLEKWLPSVAPGLNYGAVRRFIRLKKIRVNGKPAKDGTVLSKGDVARVYIEDAYFDRPPAENRLLAGFTPHIKVIYEDANIMLIDKRPGMRVHPDDEEKVDTLVTHIQAYLYRKGEYSGEGFAPAVCNRIDRFTGGIVIAAKNRDALRAMDMKIRAREVEKYYLLACAGRLTPAEGSMRGYLVKDGKRMRTSEKGVPGAVYAETEYRTLSVQGDMSLVECRLVTGRTHQIRAQFAAAGHPLIGDTQYGSREVNGRHRSNFQQLYAYKVGFAFKDDGGPLGYLKGRAFQVPIPRGGFAEMEELVRRGSDGNKGGNDGGKKPEV